MLSKEEQEEKYKEKEEVGDPLHGIGCANVWPQASLLKLFITCCLASSRRQQIALLRAAAAVFMLHQARRRVAARDMAMSVLMMHALCASYYTKSRKFLRF